MDERDDRLTEREQALPEHETREAERREEATGVDSESSDIDEAALDERRGPPPITRSG
jgi:hypothetical protein